MRPNYSQYPIRRQQLPPVDEKSNSSEYIAPSASEFLRHCINLHELQMLLYSFMNMPLRFPVPNRKNPNNNNNNKEKKSLNNDNIQEGHGDLVFEKQRQRRGRRLWVVDVIMEPIKRRFEYHFMPHHHHHRRRRRLHANSSNMMNNESYSIKSNRVVVDKGNDDDDDISDEEETDRIDKV